MRQEDVQKCLVIWKEVELTEAHLTVSSSLATDPDGFYVAELIPSGEYSQMKLIDRCEVHLTDPS